MTPEIVDEAADIFDLFNLEEIRQLLSEQLVLDSAKSSELATTDYFKPLYHKYKAIMSTEENTDEVKEAAEERFMRICDIFISLIAKKFGFSISPEWKSDNYSQIPALTLAIYSFFVLEFSTNLIDVCRKYLEENADLVFETFEEKKMKKDAVTLVHKKEMTIENAVVISNIYDITTWIFSQLSEEQFFKLLSPEYIPLTILQKLYEQGDMTGEFVVAIHDIYSQNVSLKGDVCFQIISMIKKGTLSMQFKKS